MGNDGDYDDSNNYYYSREFNWTNCETVLWPRENIILALVAVTVLLLFVNFSPCFNRCIIQSLEWHNVIYFR